MTTDPFTPLDRATEAEGGARIQTVILKKTEFETRRAALDWMMERIEAGRGFHVDKIDETSTSFRFRQFDPDDCETDPRTIQLTDGVSAVICTPTSNAREAIAIAPVALTAETPGQFEHRIHLLNSADLIASEDLLAFHAAREATVGRGWTPERTRAALRAVRAHRTIAREQHELDMTAPHVDDHVSPRREGGIHAHTLQDDGATDGAGGRHAHAFLYRGAILFTEHDGAHAHESGEDGRTAPESEHKHAAILRMQDGETLIVEFVGATAHDHEKLTSTTALDGLHQHSAEINSDEVATLTPEEFRALFGVIEEIRFSTSLAEDIGANRLETGGLSLQQFWAAGKGTTEVRELLASYVRGDGPDAAVRETVEEHQVGSNHTVVENFVVWLGSETIAIQESDEDKFILIGSESPALKLREFNASLGAARLAATAAVNEENSYIPLARFVGTALEGPAEGKPIYRDFATYHLVRDAVAREAVAREAVDTALEQLTRRAGAYHCGHFIGAREAESHAWDVVVIEAGISRNRNFWPTSVLEKLAKEGTFDGSPLEAIQASPTKLSHLPVEAVMRLRGHSITMNGVGQLQDLAFEADGGTVPDDDEVRILAKVLGVTEAEVRKQSKGRLIAIARLDKSDTGSAIEDRLASAAERGSLEDYLGLSIDVDRAPAVGINVPGKAPILLRTDIDGAGGKVLVDFVTHPSAGGKVLGRSAA